MVSPVRARGILGMALTWGIGLAVLATLLLGGGLLLGVVPSSVFGIRELIAVAGRNLAFGAAVGALFAAILSRGERARTLGTLTRRRVGTWGAVSGAVSGAVLATVLVLAAPVTLPVAVLLAAVVAYGVLGAGLAVGTLAVARRAPAVGPGEAEPRVLPPAI